MTFDAPRIGPYGPPKQVRRLVDLLNEGRTDIAHILRSSNMHAHPMTDRDTPPAVFRIWYGLAQYKVQRGGDGRWSAAETPASPGAHPA